MLGVMETFVERWFTEGDVPAIDVYFVHESARFEVRARGEVVFTCSQFVDVLRFCMRDSAPELRSAELRESIEVSAPWEPEDSADPPTAS